MGLPLGEKLLDYATRTRRFVVRAAMLAPVRTTGWLKVPQPPDLQAADSAGAATFFVSF